MHQHVNIAILLFSLLKSISSNTVLLVEPPPEVRAFPGQNVTLPCIFKNFQHSEITASWDYIGDTIIHITDDQRFLKSVFNKFQFSFPGEGNNFTLHIVIPESNEIDFEDDVTVTKQFKFVVTMKKTLEKNSFISNLIIQKTPICSSNETVYTSGQTITFGCLSVSDPSMSTNWKSQKGQILPSKLTSTTLNHTSNVTKEDNDAIYYCESQIIATNETRSCSVGPITVNHKPEITITKISPTEYNCTAKARPPVNETVWIIDSNVPEDEFTISNEQLKFNELPKVGSQLTITCEAVNVLDKQSKSMIIQLYNEEDKELPVTNTTDITFYFILLCVAIIIIIILIIVLCHRKCKTDSRESSRGDKVRNLPTDLISDDYQTLQTMNNINNRTVEFNIDELRGGQEDGYEVPKQTIRQDYQPLTLDTNDETEAYETIPSIDIGQSFMSENLTYITTIDDTNEQATAYETIPSIDRGQSSEVTSENLTYITTLDGRLTHVCQQETESATYTEIGDKEEVGDKEEIVPDQSVENSTTHSYVNNLRVGKQRQLHGN